ncbi:MAG: 50S ribosomal protein L23 [Candidatus Cloacimonetes bacterium]|nr:50S ribosomal protein L23 [Candidatus Cloacimonadota bacterium]MBL7085604.1 50S ribosomal protein L23 [Candidatus Cloacimonadota bacterium]
MTKYSREIIIHPIITEKGTHIKEDANGYLFKVQKNANKIGIKKAIEDIFDVKVRSVNTINYKGKPKTLGRFSGKRANWKKAIVFLEEGESIREFET